MNHFTSTSEAQTIENAQKFARTLIAGDMVLLNGDLGAGKTVFARALIRALSDNYTLDVPSPTYTLLQTYNTPRAELYHYDLYRLDTPEEIYELSWEEATDTKSIAVIEWPERLGTLTPRKHISITIKNDAQDQNTRHISIAKQGYQP